MKSLLQQLGTERVSLGAAVAAAEAGAREDAERLQAAVAELTALRATVEDLRHQAQRHGLSRAQVQVGEGVIHVP